MSGLTIINHAAAQAHEWINELQSQMKLPNQQSAYAALRAVLHHLRDRLPVKENADLSAQLPTLIRGIYFEGWSPKEGRSLPRSTEEFVQAVFATLSEHPEIHAGNATRAVFALLDTKISHGEMNDVIQSFPVEMRNLWPREAVARLGANEGR